jgi:hypothetical protein
MLGGAARPHRSRRRPCRAAVVLVTDGDLAWCDQRMAGDLAAVVDDHDLAAEREQLDLRADQPLRHRVAGRAETDTAEPVDLAQLPLPQRRPQRRQRAQRLPLTLEPLSRDSAGLRVAAAVDLGAPDDGGLVRLAERGERALGDEQVGLCVADQMLDDALRLGIRRFAEVGPEAVAEREADVLRVRHDHIGDGRRAQARHPVGDHDRRHPARLLEALRQQSQHRLPAPIRGEADEAPARPGQHRAEERERPLLSPVDHEVTPR